MSDLTSTLGCFTQWPRTLYPLNRRLRGPEGLNGLNVWRIEKSITPIGIRTSDRPALSVADKLTTKPDATRIEEVTGSKVLRLISSGARNRFLSKNSRPCIPYCRSFSC